MDISANILKIENNVRKEDAILSMFYEDIKVYPGILRLLDKSIQVIDEVKNSAYYFYWRDVLNLLRERGENACFERYFKADKVALREFISIAINSEKHLKPYRSFCRDDNIFPIEIYCLMCLNRSAQTGLKYENSEPWGTVRFIYANDGDGGFSWSKATEGEWFWNQFFEGDFNFALRKIHYLYGKEIFDDIREKFKP